MRQFEADLAYCQMRDSFIPTAVKYADEAVGKIAPTHELKEVFDSMWNKVYHDKMNQLVQIHLGMEEFI